jgi:iron-sulfur cluster assembly protein
VTGFANPEEWFMLDLTENATSVIRSIAERPELPDDAGLRVTSDAAGSGRLSVSAAGGPAEGDQIVEKEGARVFLEPQAAAVLDDKVLDAQVGDQGNVQFLVSAR